MEQQPLHSGAIPKILGELHGSGRINKWPTLINGSSLDSSKEMPVEALDDDNLYAISIYAREVIPKPELDGNKIHYTLFSEIYLTEKRYFLGSNIQRSRIGAVSRTYKQAATFNPNIDPTLCPNGYENAGFEWLIYWKPKKAGTYKISNPLSEVPFYVVEKTIELLEIKNETLRIPFFFKNNVEEEVVVLRVGTPLFTLEYLG